MLVALGSDIHLEFSDINLENTNGAEVLILAGDILIAQDLHDHPEPIVGPNLGSKQQRAIRYRNFLKRCSDNFKHVIYIAGNHEFYHGTWNGSLVDLRNECAKFSNIYFLENDVKVIEDVTFIGCTLWTDMNRGDPMTYHAISDMMNDFSIIRNDAMGYTKLRPAHAHSRHRNSLSYIQNVVAEKHDQKFVVVGHHAPCTLSINEIYKNDKLMNGGYASDLSEFILDRPQIKAWAMGHTHHVHRYYVGETLVVCNPRGYAGHELSADQFKLRYIDLDNMPEKFEGVDWNWEC